MLVGSYLCLVEWPHPSSIESVRKNFPRTYCRLENLSSFELGGWREGSRFPATAESLFLVPHSDQTKPQCSAQVSAIPHSTLREIRQCRRSERHQETLRCRGRYCHPSRSPICRTRQPNSVSDRAGIDSLGEHLDPRFVRAVVTEEDVLIRRRWLLETQVDLVRHVITRTVA